MLERTEKEVVYMTHCCLCGYRLGKTAPGSKVYMTCPKCGTRFAGTREDDGELVEEMELWDGDEDDD